MIEINFTITFTVHNLGILYTDQGKLDYAEKNVPTRTSRNREGVGIRAFINAFFGQHLGSIYADYGKLNQAEKMYQRTLQGREKALGE